MTRKATIAALILFLIAGWFLGVDWSLFVHECPDCGYGKDVAQYRVFTIPVHEHIDEFPTVEQKIGTDLGVPCRHENSTNWNKHRWWGLCYCRAPCINGMYRLSSDDSWYDAEASARVASLAKNDPDLPREFGERVCQEHQVDFVRTVLDRAGIDSKVEKERSND